MVARWGAKFGCAVLLLSLVMLAIANFIGAPLWTITLAAAGVLVAGNLWVHYLQPSLRVQWKRRRRASPASSGGSGGGSGGAGNGSSSSGSSASSDAGGQTGAPLQGGHSGSAVAPGKAAAAQQNCDGSAAPSPGADLPAAAAAGQPVSSDIELVIMPHASDASTATLAGRNSGSGNAQQLHGDGSLRRRHSAGLQGGDSAAATAAPADFNGATRQAAADADEPVSWTAAPGNNASCHAHSLPLFVGRHTASLRLWYGRSCQPFPGSYDQPC